MIKDDHDYLFVVKKLFVFRIMRAEKLNGLTFIVVVSLPRYPFRNKDHLVNELRIYIVVHFDVDWLCNNVESVQKIVETLVIKLAIESWHVYNLVVNLLDKVKWVRKDFNDFAFDVIQLFFFYFESFNAFLAFVAIHFLIRWAAVWLDRAENAGWLFLLGLFILIVGLKPTLNELFYLIFVLGFDFLEYLLQMFLLNRLVAFHFLFMIFMSRKGLNLIDAFDLFDSFQYFVLK